MTDDAPSYRILRLVESNFKRIKALDISPARGVNRIAARNKQGKTSCIDGIEAAIAGAKFFPQQPVRTGTDKSEILCVLGDERPELLVKRVIHESGKTTLEITSAEGFKAPTPQAILDGLYNRLAFNPQAFLFMDDDKKLDMLRKLVGLDFSEKDKTRKKLYEDRTVANKNIKTISAQAAAIAVPEDTPSEEVSLMDLMVEQKRRQEHNRQNQVERDKLPELTRTVALGKTDIAKKEVSILQLQKQLDDAKAELSKETESLQQAILLRDAQTATINVLEDHDVDEVQASIVNAQTINSNVALGKRKAELVKQAENAAAESESLTTQIDAIDAEKERLLSEAKWPVEGLSFGELGVLYNGVPISQASGAEQLDISFAMGASMNPQLRVALIRNASLLDDEQMQVVCRRAEQMDMQVFLEIVSEEAGPATVVIEDGEVTSGGTQEDTPVFAKKAKQAEAAAVVDRGPFDDE